MQTYWNEKAQKWQPESEVKSFAVHANKRPWRFTTMREAVAAANETTGQIVGITASFSKAPTHRHIIAGESK